jgi:hypothetical protein
VSARARPRHYGLCASFVTAQYQVTVYKICSGVISVEDYVASHALTNASTLKLRLVQLNGLWTDRRQV